MIAVFSGLPGSGKTHKLAKTAIEVLYRNRRYYKKTGVIRMLMSNIRLSEAVEEEFHGFIEYWWEPRQLTSLRDVDVLWDEIAAHLDAVQWANMSLELKRWLQQHRKHGVDIYGTAQDFAQIDKSMRRLTSDLLYMTKIIGSRDISPTKPNPRFIWGVVIVKTLDPVVYDEDKSKQTGTGLFPRLMFITKRSVSVFDTTQEIKQGEYPPLRHITRTCEKPDCDFHKLIHA